MPTRNPNTDYYSVEVTVAFVERNQYHEVLSEGSLHFGKKVKTNLAGCAQLITALDRAVDGASIE